MTSAIRLYDRLDQIPQDPEDPESLDDLIVCAFGAFERYYVCWKNKAGEYRQDGYDLPPALQEWLWPNDNTTRDFPSLQVVFGRGDEYFASDINGKLEYKEPEKKPLETTTPEEKPILRRTRTMSSFRAAPSPDITSKPLPSVPDESPSSSPRSSAAYTSRPPSMSFSARSMSDASFISSRSRSPSLSSLYSTVDTMTTIASRPPSLSVSDLKPSSALEEYYLNTPPPPKSALRLQRRSRPLSMSFKPQTKPFPLLLSAAVDQEYGTLTPTFTPQSSYHHHHHQTIPPPTTTPHSCTCQHPPPPQQPHPQPQKSPRISIYLASAVQTSPRQPNPPPPQPPPPAAALPQSSFSPTSSTSSSPSPTITPQNPQQTFLEEEEEYHYYEDDIIIEPPAVNPFPMGSMMAFFSKPGYQLGDGLMRRGYGFFEEARWGVGGGDGDDGEQVVYEAAAGEEGAGGGYYEEQDVEGWAEWEAANGRWA
ncbi:hypothetical protein DM02DRAFT_671128 [Periconia macrospinosa]|uniref:Uncharacterized protein n=1 Tax=Periconia macrospinosa TaxID=97972 RepID=A0A2V1DTS3_9PLEO|nr:hypothetical protein DM02DRAFT_671128 [Periconia macrospinosa]